MEKVRVLYFAALRDLTRTDEEWVELPDGVRTVREAFAHLERVRPELAGRLAGVRGALNETFADGGDTIGPGDTLALIPPVSGG